MSTAIVKFYATVGSRVSQLPLSDGNLIFVTDTKKMYLDFNGVRVEYSDIVTLSKESDRLSILAPSEGFYFVEETDVIWRYKEGWKQLTPDNVNPLFFGDYDEFPEIGKDGTLYISDDATYRWDSLTSEYICISTKNIWEEF